MRLSVFGLFLGLLSFVSALSATGSKLLVVLEEDSEKSKYSQFWTDLEGEQRINSKLNRSIGC